MELGYFGTEYVDQNYMYQLLAESKCTEKNRDL